MERRQFLRIVTGATGSALCLGCLSACSTPIYDEPDDSVVGEATLNREDLPLWPAPGEAVAVDIPSQYWSLLLIRLEADTWCGVWRVCTHGACEVEWQSSTGLVQCPCHGSEFTVDDGVPQSGPATRPLPTFAVTQSDEALVIRRVS